MSGLRTSEGTANLVAALAKAQRLIQPAIKDSVNPHLRNKYADLAAVMAACLPHLTAHNLAVVQVPQVENGWCTVTTRLAHDSGEWMENDLALPITKLDAQGIGSTITYGRRYGLSAMVGVVQDDDDGNGAVGQPTPPASRRAQPSAPARNTAPPTAGVSSRAKAAKEPFGVDPDEVPSEAVEAPMELVVQLLDAIRNAESLDRLRLIWPAVYSEAKKYPDLLADCTREKDARKVELEAQE